MKGSMKILPIIFLILFILKLSNNIDISWLWVTSPIWLPILFSLAMFSVILGIFIIALILMPKNEDGNNRKV